MKLFRDLPHNQQEIALPKKDRGIALTEKDRGIALTIGNFDGMHLGHQALLSETLRVAKERGLHAAAMTFEPHPREFFDPANAPARLSSLREKAVCLQKAGIEYLYVCRFNQSFAQQSPENFVTLLQQRLLCRWLLVGEDFRFGAKRSGDVALLRSRGQSCGVDVATLPDINLDGLRISSTAVREALACGNMHLAEALLGRPYSISGRVQHGNKLGRTIGFPTANVSLSNRKPALIGVYAVKCTDVRVRGLEGVATGVASLGTNPTVRPAKPAPAGGRHSLEVFLFDFSDDLYGKRINVEFCEKLRDEAKFPSLDALRTQIQRDSDAAREYFAADRR